MGVSCPKVLLYLFKCFLGDTPKKFVCLDLYNAVPCLLLETLSALDVWRLRVKVPPRSSSRWILPGVLPHLVSNVTGHWVQLNGSHEFHYSR